MDPTQGNAGARLQRIEIAGRRLEYYWTRPRAAGETVLIFLHEGLGSALLWRDFPALVGARTGCPALVYSRYGYGGSDVLDAPRGVDYMHREALDVLPELRARLGIGNAVLVGHSDGASIALIHAGAGRWPVRALVLEAPHVFVEDASVAGIEAAKRAFAETHLAQRLARYHADAAKTFRGWNDIWLDPAFRGWNIEASLPAVACPVLAIQGADDEYGTVRQLAAIRDQVGGPVETLVLPACGHAPHRDRPAAVLAAMSEWLNDLRPALASSGEIGQSGSAARGSE